MITVRIDAVLIEACLTQGYTTNGILTVTEGLPVGATLHHVVMENGYLVLSFVVDGEQDEPERVQSIMLRLD